MSEINLEKLDLVKERTGATYTEAKEALEVNNGDVVDAIVYLESKKKCKGNFYTSKDELVNWIKDMVNKGNVTRIKLKKDETVLVDIPVTAGVTVAGLAVLLAPLLLAIGVVGAVVTKITVEITKEDGSVEVVNKYIQNTVEDVKDKLINITDKFEEVTEDVKDKITEMAEDIKEKLKGKKPDSNTNTEETNVYKYTVKFEDTEKIAEKVEEKEKDEEKSDK